MSKRNMAAWLRDNRSSTRLAFLLQLGARFAASFMGLMWFRLLVGAIGTEVYQNFLTFNKLITLGGLGDLGMGGVVGLRTAQHLGQQRPDELRKFLASARCAFLLLALVAGGVVLLLSPWLPAILQFKQVPGSGSLRLLFCVGSLLVAGLIISSYLNNLNYACGNVTWPIIPSFLLVQLGLLGHWLLARQHEPLWIQCLPYAGTAALGMIFVSAYIRASHPALAGWTPLRADWRLIGSLLEGSVWIYLCGLGNAVYRSTDALVINAGSLFPAGTLTGYDANYRACDVTVSLAVTAGFVSMPKITRWLASPEAGERERARTEIHRLNQFQALLGFGAALAYLAGNNLFMKIWWWHRETQVPAASVALQIAFALNMAITTGADAGLQVAIRADHKGLRVAGSIIAFTALLNVGLALIAMRAGSLVGIALATVLAQSFQSLCAGAYACRRLNLAWLPWAFRTWLLPVSGIAAAGWLRQLLPLDSALHVFLLLGVYLAIVVVAARVMGVNMKFIKDEFAVLAGFLKR